MNESVDERLSFVQEQLDQLRDRQKDLEIAISVLEVEQLLLQARDRKGNQTNE